MLVGIALTLLSVLGFLISLYFTLVYYQRIPANYFLVPRVCRMNESTCQTVLSTREARVFGVPNFILGLAYYTLVILVGVLLMLGSEASWFRILFCFSLVTVLLAGYLSYSLLIKIRIACPLCFTSHAINTAIAVLLYFKTT
jgi:uncharacterized membrane protein